VPSAVEPKASVNGSKPPVPLDEVERHRAHKAGPRRGGESKRAASPEAAPSEAPAPPAAPAARSSPDGVAESLMRQPGSDFGALVTRLGAGASALPPALAPVEQALGALLAAALLAQAEGATVDAPRRADALERLRSLCRHKASPVAQSVLEHAVAVPGVLALLWCLLTGASPPASEVLAAGDSDSLLERGAGDEPAPLRKAADADRDPAYRAQIRAALGGRFVDISRISGVQVARQNGFSC